LLLPALCWTIFSFGQTAQVRSKINTGKITIGEHVQLFLEVQPQTAQDKIKWPNFAADSLQGLEWVEFGKVDTIKTKDSLLYKQKLTLTGFDSGAYSIPAFKFVITSSGNKVQEFSTDSFVIQVQSIAVDTSKAFMPINDIIQVKASWLDYWKTILIVILAIALVSFLIFYFYKKWKLKSRHVPEKVTPEKAHETTLRLLDELKSKKLWQNGNVKEYYASLSNILRNYLDNRFEVNAMELTTDDLLKLAKQDKRLKGIRQELKRILKTADLAKYAKAEPLPTEQEACLDAAYLMVQKTKIQGMEAGEK